jgi:nitrite reductase (NADH) small subunit
MSTHWIDVAACENIPLQGARRVMIGDVPVAIFASQDGDIFALIDRCPHKGGPLSQGIVHGRAVACPLHNWSISLETGQAKAPDKGCAHSLSTNVVNGRVLVDVSSLTSRAYVPSAVEA